MSLCKSRVTQASGDACVMLSCVGLVVMVVCVCGVGCVCLVLVVVWVGGGGCV